MSEYPYHAEPSPAVIPCPICAHRLISSSRDIVQIDDGAAARVTCYGCGTERQVYEQRTRISAVEENWLSFSNLFPRNE